MFKSRDHQSLLYHTLPTTVSLDSYPKGNFEWNQLSDGSMILSPRYQNLTINLHDKTATQLHQRPPWLRPLQAECTIFRDTIHMLTLRPFSRRIVAGRLCPRKRGPTNLTFILHWVCHPSTRMYVRLLGPCYKTGHRDAYSDPATAKGTDLGKSKKEK